MKKAVIVFVLLIAGVFNQSATASGQNYEQIHKSVYKSIKFPKALARDIDSEKVKIKLVLHPDGRIVNLGVTSQNEKLQHEVQNQVDQIVLNAGMVDQPTTFIFNINFKVL